MAHPRIDLLARVAEQQRPSTPTYVRESQRTTTEQRWAVIALRKEQRSIRYIAKRVGMSTNAVLAIISRWTATGTTGSGSRSGRPKITKPDTDAKIVDSSHADPFATPRKIRSDLQLSCSPRTIDRRLQEEGLPGRVARNKREYTPEQLRARISFAEGYKNLDWHRVMCGDEKNFYVDGHQGRVWVRRPVGASLDPKYTQHKIAHPEYVRVWACISAAGQGDIVFLDGALDGDAYATLMRDYLPLAADKAFTFGSGPWYYLHDNPTTHKGDKTKEALHKIGATVLDFPPYSPDLNPIENLWSILAANVNKRHCRNVEDLAVIVEEEWDKLDKNIFTKLLDSMKTRCDAVVKQKGWHTGY